ncbi:hypothetical protein [Actinoplanes sp. CA-252034]|uniref:hypothetical protein n=1 Tax=Actinoplanes sp. CA-252034 TaxID=3239906 RepID=UPI003D991E4C
MRKRLQVGDVAVAPLPGGGFGACQVSGFDGESVVIHALDWSSPEPPGLDDLRGVGPAVLSRHRFRAEIAQTSVAPRYHPLPPDLTWIGTLPVPPGVPGEVDSISGWDWPLIATVLQREWADLPEEARAARRRSRGADPVTIDRGDGPQTETVALEHLDLSAYPPGRPMDWSVLDRLPRCTGIHWSGPDRGLVAALGRHPMVSSLTWSDAPETVDLTRTRITSLRITGDSLRQLHLAPRARTLTIDGPPTPTVSDGVAPPPAANAASSPPADNGAAAPTTGHASPVSDATLPSATGATSPPPTGDAVSAQPTSDAVSTQPTNGAASVRTVRALDDGRWLHLDIFAATPATVAPAGLSGVRSVSLSGAGALSADTIAAFLEAHTVSLRWTSPPGRLDNPTALTALTHLRLLQMFDAYAMDADTLPDLPLDDLLISGLRGSTARGLRARFRKSPVTLSLTGAKSDRWLAANLDNPFRDWADDNPTAGAAACKAYATALKALDKPTALKPFPHPLPMSLPAPGPLSVADEPESRSGSVITSAEAVLRGWSRGSTLWTRSSASSTLSAAKKRVTPSWHWRRAPGCPPPSPASGSMLGATSEDHPRSRPAPTAWSGAAPQLVVTRWPVRGSALPV